MQPMFRSCDGIEGEAVTIGKVKRETTAFVRFRGRDRAVIVVVHKNGTIGLRAKGCRPEFYVAADTLFYRLEKEDAESHAGTSVAPCRNPQKRFGAT